MDKATCVRIEKLFYQEWLQEQETQALSEEAWKPIQVMAEERKANQWHDQEWWWRSERGLSQAQEDWWRQRWNQLKDNADQLWAEADKKSWARATDQ